MRSLLLILIRIYQWVLSPYIGKSCRFYPTCSCYAHEAIQHFGAWKGMGLTIHRISRCHPWNDGGYDPVPSKANSNENETSTSPATSHPNIP